MKRICVFNPCQIKGQHSTTQGVFKRSRWECNFIKRIERFKRKVLSWVNLLLVGNGGMRDACRVQATPYLVGHHRVVPCTCFWSHRMDTWCLSPCLMTFLMMEVGLWKMGLIWFDFQRWCGLCVLIVEWAWFVVIWCAFDVWIKCFWSRNERMRDGEDRMRV